MYRLNHNQSIIELLIKLRAFQYEYPPDLVSARRASFIRMVSRYVIALVRV